MVIQTIARLSIIMTAPISAVLMRKLVLRVLDDDTLGYITVQIKTGVFAQLQDWDNVC